MKPELIELIGNARKKRGHKFRQQLYILIVCFVLSLFFWILIRLSKNYDYTYEYRLQYIGLQESYAMQSVSDSILSLKITLQGYDYFREHLFAPQIRTYPVSLSRIRKKQQGDHYTAYMLTRGLARDIVSQTTFPSEVISVNPDTLFFVFRKRAR